MRPQPQQLAQPTFPQATQQPLDLLVTGPVFFDLVFTGLPSGPTPGTEVWASGMGSAPGGIANLAIAASRLGLTTGLAGAFGDDAYADYLWTVLGKQEGVDLSASRRYRHWHTSVTVSLAMANDRAMISHGHPAPEPASAMVSGARPAHAVVAELSADGEPWWRELAARGSLIFADVGWDPEEAWDPAWLDLLEGCHAVTPNAVEAMAYTRADSPLDAARALGERVPLAVVTRGADGAVAVDSGTGEEVEVDPLHVEALDPTGAGDVFGAALITGTINGWDLLRRLRFAVLCSALAVRQFGGSLAAPGWGDIADWWETTVADARTGDRAARETAARYDFLDDALPGHPLARVRRADATMARLADVSTGEGPAPTVRSSQ